MPRLQASSSQADEDDFSGGAWAAMRAEMGLDERNPSCFLHSYSVVMVLRKVSAWRLTAAIMLPVVCYISWTNNTMSLVL